MTQQSSPVLPGYVAVIDDFNPLATDDYGTFLYVARLREVKERSPVQPKVLQLPIFPAHLVPGSDDRRDMSTLLHEIRKLDVQPLPIFMLDVDPLDPAEEDRAVEVLSNGMMWSYDHGVSIGSGTSLEEWLNGRPPLTGVALDEAVQRLVNIHVMACRKARHAGKDVDHYDIEYLRPGRNPGEPGEFSTFTNIEVASRVVNGINETLEFPFARLLDDTAHAGDSQLSMERINAARVALRDSGAYGITHFSQPTTRGMPPAGQYAENSFVDACVHGKVSIALAEAFPPEVDTLQALRDADLGFGEVTFEDRTQVIVDMLVRMDGMLRKAAEMGNVVYPGD